MKSMTEALDCSKRREFLFRSFVLEDSEEYVRHDQLCKELIETFFEEFVEAFFPELHADISFEKLIFLSEEIWLICMMERNKYLILLPKYVGKVLMY